MPSEPPVINGLSVWLCSDTNVDMRPDETVVSWAAANGSGLRAAAIGSTRPQWLENQINGYPVLRFAGAQGLFLETGLIAQDNFTLVVVGRSFDERQYGGEGLSGQKMLFYQDGSAALTHAAVSVGWNGVGVYEFGVSEAPRAEVNDVGADCLCPLVVRYENKALKVWLGGGLVIDDGSVPSQPVNAPHGIGGTGGVEGGFAGGIAEVLIYDRALSDGEREQVEQYVREKYACGSSSSSASSEMSSYSASSEDGSSSSSSSEPSHDDSSSSESSSSESGGIYFTASLVELLNPHASDFDWTEVEIVNETGTPVASVQFQSLSESEGFAAAAEENSDSPLELTAEMKDPSTVSIKAAAWGINTKYGKAGATFNATFKDAQGSVIGTSTIGFEAMATIRGSLEQSRDLAEFNPQFRASFSQPFYQTAATIAFNNTNAPSEIQFGVSDSIMVQDALFKADLSATINDLENISIKRLVAAGSFEIPFVQTTTVQTSLVGSFENVFSEEFPGNYQMNWTGDQSRTRNRMEWKRSA